MVLFCTASYLECSFFQVQWRPILAHLQLILGPFFATAHKGWPKKKPSVCLMWTHITSFLGSRTVYWRQKCWDMYVILMVKSLSHVYEENFWLVPIRYLSRDLYFEVAPNNFGWGLTVLLALLLASAPAMPCFMNRLGLSLQVSWSLNHFALIRWILKKGSIYDFNSREQMKIDFGKTIRLKATHILMKWLLSISCLIGYYLQRVPEIQFRMYSKT